MKILYCDCFSGISGDMFLAAMLDAGLPLETLSEGLKKLGLPEYYGFRVNKVNKGAIAASQLEFNLDDPTHDHVHEPEHPHVHIHQRNLADILALIQSSTLSGTVQKQAAAIFQKLAEAEAKVHGVATNEVHFHEVGATDSILDIVGAAIALEYFQVEEVYASALPMGSGSVMTQHGLLPLPAPATLELLTMARAKMVPSNTDKEMVTPTGAAILAALAKFDQPELRLNAIGMGAGHNELPWPNVLRLLIGERDEASYSHVEIETNIDDMNPQFYASVMQHLFDQGALDVYFTPIQMKKNRPGIKLSVIAAARDESALSQILLRETSTLGVRIKELQRHEATRSIQRVSTRFGEVSIKLKQLGGRVVQANPEYEECLTLAEDFKIPVAEVYQEIQAAAASLITS